MNGRVWDALDLARICKRLTCTCTRISLDVADFSHTFPEELPDDGPVHTVLQPPSTSTMYLYLYVLYSTSIRRGAEKFKAAWLLLGGLRAHTKPGLPRAGALGRSTHGNVTGFYSRRLLWGHDEGSTLQPRGSKVLHHQHPSILLLLQTHVLCATSIA